MDTLSILLTVGGLITIVINLAAFMKLSRKNHRLERKLHETISWFDACQESTGIVCFAKDGTLAYVNNAAKRFFSSYKLEPNEINFHKTQIIEFLQVFGDIKPLSNEETRSQSKEQTEYWRFVDHKTSKQYELSCRTLSSLGVEWKINETVNEVNQESISENKGHYFEDASLFLEQVPIGIFTCDDQLNIGYMNAFAQDVIGNYHTDGVFPIEYLSEKEFAKLDAYCNACHENGISKSDTGVEIQFNDKPDQSYRFQLLSTALNDDGEKVSLVYIVDVTERKKLEQQFVQSQKMQAVGQLAGGVAHDFNNMLTAMIGFCDLLLLRHQPGDPSFVDTMQIKQNANRAAGLVRQLLAFSRMDKMEARSLNLVDILSELTSLLNRLLGDNVELKLIHGRDLGRIKFDQVQFEQMIINLALNARDAMPNGGKLQIQTEKFKAKKEYKIRDQIMPAGDYISISVTDTGIGISKENMQHIFDPFFTTKDVGEGTGLGLSMVIGSVQQADGYVFVHSDGPGKGTTFILYLPETELDDTEVVDVLGDDIETKDVTGVEHILLVEDEDAVRSFAARALRSKGYMVTEARAGDVAIDLLNNGDAASDFDLLITDMMMPRVSGVEVIKAARKKYEKIPVICISGYTKDTVAADLSDIQALHFLPKPFSLKQLAVRVKEAIDSPLAIQGAENMLPKG